MLSRIRNLSERRPFRRRSPDASPPAAGDWPALSAEHVRAARLFANRQSMIVSLAAGRCRTVVEVGVGLGDFSEFILQSLDPTKFVAIDLFDWHNLGQLWGRPTRSIFGGLSHLEYYRRRLESYGDRVVFEQGVSWEVLGRYPDEYFDLVYIDAGHDYESVKLDAEQAVGKVKADGLIIFNDYTVFDNYNHSPYGVVPAVNQLVEQGGWDVVGLALDRNMFCDIAISRRPAAT